VQATAGIEVAGEAVSGEESFDAARALRPDLVLMDVNMPSISGTEATRRIRAAFPGIGVLLLSVRDTDETATASVSAASCTSVMGASTTTRRSMSLPET